MIKNQSNQFENSFEDQCARGEMLIAVLYNEADESEKGEFQNHVLSCAICARELADFKILRPQIVEYYERAFQPLDLSKIVLENSTDTDAATRRGLKPNWLERLRANVSSVVLWRQPTIAFAAFAICAALFLWFGYALINQNQQQFAVNSQPTIETNNNSSVAEIAASSAAKEQPPPPQTSEFKQTPAAPLQSVNRLSSKQRSVQPDRAKKTNSAAAKTQTVKSPRQATGTTIGLDTEADDEAPLLSDLFDEIGSLR